MMSETKEKWRVTRAAIAATTNDNKWKKEVGESAATIWLDRNRWNYFAVNAQINDKPESLVAIGGKRPDFCAQIKGELIYLDAKYHSCPNNEFYIEEDEIDQYVKLRKWLLIEQLDSGERDIIFMIFPQKHNATKLIFVHLDELILGEVFLTDRGKSAKKVRLDDRDNLTFEVTLIPD
jgi:hypothetical protein